MNTVQYIGLELWRKQSSVFGVLDGSKFGNLFVDR